MKATSWSPTRMPQSHWRALPNLWTHKIKVTGDHFFVYSNCYYCCSRPILCAVYTSKPNHCIKVKKIHSKGGRSDIGHRKKSYIPTCQNCNWLPPAVSLFAGLILAYCQISWSSYLIDEYVSCALKCLHGSGFVFHSYRAESKGEEWKH